MYPGEFNSRSLPQLRGQHRHNHASYDNLRSARMRHYDNRYPAHIFNGESYITRPARHRIVKKESVTAQYHKRKLIPLMVNVESFLQDMKKRRFKGPRKFKHIKPPKPPIIVSAKHGIRPGVNTPINKEVKKNFKIVTEPDKVDIDEPVKKPKRISKKKRNTVKPKVNNRIKLLWKKVRLISKYLWFPKWWFKREYRKIVRVKELSLLHQQKNWEEVTQHLIKITPQLLAKVSLNSAWYDTTNFNICFDQALLENYFLDQDATTEEIFLEFTKDRVANVHVRISYLTKLTLFQEKAITIFQEISANFTVDNLGTKVFDFLKVISYGDVYFKSDFLTVNELRRLKFRPCGLTQKYSSKQQKMILGNYLLIKILSCKVLGNPFLHIRTFPIDSLKRLQVYFMLMLKGAQDFREHTLLCNLGIWICLLQQ